MYDPRDDQELRDMIEASLRVLDPDVVCDEDEDVKWLIVAGDIPAGMDPAAADDAGYDVVFIDYEIVSADTYGDDGKGYNVGWTMTRWGGEILAQCMPYNYTSRVWTRSKDEIYARAIDTLDTLRWWVNGREWNNRG